MTQMTQMASGSRRAHARATRWPANTGHKPRAPFAVAACDPRSWAIAGGFAAGLPLQHCYLRNLRHLRLN